MKLGLTSIKVSISVYSHVRDLMISCFPDRQFLQQKQQLMRAREAALWDMEERQLHERHQLAKRQLKDMFFLQRHQMLVHHEKELDHLSDN